MKFWTLSMSIVVLLGMNSSIAASAAVTNDLPPAAALYGDVNRKVQIVFDIHNTGLLYPRNSEVKELETPSRTLNPWTSVYNGKFYVSTDADGKKVSEFGEIMFKVVEGFRLYTLRRIGPGENAIGCDTLSKIWVVDQHDKPTAVATRAYRRVIAQNGAEQSLLMHRTIQPEGDWIGDLGGKIVRETKDRKLEQIGWVQWRSITLPGGKPMTILMTRGMSPGGKWMGRFQGVLYRDK